MQAKRITLGLMFLALAAFPLIQGCGGGGSDGGNGGGGGTGSTSGVVSATVTDAPSDEIESFVVDVNALTLKKDDGSIVTLVNAPVTVDLASLTDVTELLNQVDVPAGTYTSATITLDFTNASCLLAGQSTPAQLQDDAGVALTGTLEMPVEFGSLPFTVEVDKHRLLEFDFDLDQSASVDSTANTVSIDPVFALHINGSGKKLETLGTLVSVNVGGMTFIGSIKTLHGVVFSDVNYTTDSNTIFQVDGVANTGNLGLTSLNAKAAGTWIQVFGQIDPDSSAIHADYVEAGTGTYNGQSDIIEGHVIDRAGNPAAGQDVTLSVLGYSSNAAHTTIQFNQTFTVTTTFADTKVVRPFSSQAYNTDAVNVGQRVRIFGTLNGTSMAATQPNDVIREEVSRAFGHATGAIASGTLTLNLQHVDLRPESAFTWTDSGTTVPVPTAFTADVGSLGNNLGIGNGTAVEVRGFFKAVDDNGQDFAVQTLVDVDSAPSLLFVRNLPAGFTVALTTSSSEIQIAITGVALPAEKAIIDQGFAGTIPLPTTPTPTVQPAGSGGLFVLRDKVTGKVTPYFNFAAFSTALGNAITGGANVATFGATGNYTLATNTMQATFVSVIVN